MQLPNGGQDMPLPEPVPSTGPEMEEPTGAGPETGGVGEGEPTEPQDNTGCSEIDDIFSKLDTEQQAAVIKYAKSMVGDADSQPEENEMVTELGYFKVWNCGLIKYIWRNQ